MKTLPNAGNSQYLEIPKCKNAQVETISRVDLAWLAGILEGEGHIVLFYLNNKTRIGANLGVTNSDARMIKRVSEIFSAMNITYYYTLKSPSKRNSKRFVLTITVAGFTSCRRLSNAVMPYLVSKKDQAMTMVEYCNYRLALHNKRKSINANLEKRNNGRFDKSDIQKLTEKDHYYWQKLRDLKNPPVDLQRLQRKARRPLAFDVMV